MARVVVVLSVTLVVIGTHAAGAAQSGIAPTIRQELLADAKRIAAREGDRHPYDIEAIRTTVGQASRLICGGGCTIYVPPPSTPEYLVAMRGHFSCNTCPHPRKAKIGPGTVITLEYLTATMTQSGFGFSNKYFGFGFSNKYPKLRRAGTPVLLARRT